MEKRLQTVGYVEAKALADNILCMSGESLRGHEFHFSRLDAAGSPDERHPAFLITKNRTGAQYLAGFSSENILASYLHIHFAGNLKSARRFVDRCVDFRSAARKGVR